MAFDITKVTADMLQAAEGVFKAEWPKAEGAMKDVLDEEAAAFKAIADARIAGKISEEDFQRQMEDEKETLQAGLAMVRVINKKMAQDAINAALAVFSEAVKAAISAAL
jgi:predicted NUDIX family NTP pyrophosphohydrolase